MLCALYMVEKAYCCTQNHVMEYMVHYMVPSYTQWKWWKKHFIVNYLNTKRKLNNSVIGSNSIIFNTQLYLFVQRLDYKKCLDYELIKHIKIVIWNRIIYLHQYSRFVYSFHVNHYCILTNHTRSWYFNIFEFLVHCTRYTQFKTTYHNWYIAILWFTSSCITYLHAIWHTKQLSKHSVWRKLELCRMYVESSEQTNAIDHEFNSNSIRNHI